MKLLLIESTYEKSKTCQFNLYIYAFKKTPIYVPGIEFVAPKKKLKYGLIYAFKNVNLC